MQLALKQKIRHTSRPRIILRLVLKMIVTNSSLQKIDRDAERRRALAKVYSLLISLAEKAENQTALPENAETKEGKIAASTHMAVEPMNEEISIVLDSEVSVLDADQESNSVPLKSNIPS